MCRVFYMAPGDTADLRNYGELKRARVSGAYGHKPERATADEAYADMVALLSTSMKDKGFGSTFFPRVVEYPKGTKPPDYIELSLYFCIDSPD